MGTRGRSGRGDPDLPPWSLPFRFARLVPPLWVPVVAAVGVTLPPAISLERTTVSDTIGGLVATGAISFDPPERRRLGRGNMPSGGSLSIRD